MAEYKCKNCNAEIKSTDTVCPNCGKNLSEVGRIIEVNITETISVSDAVSEEVIKGQITKEQVNIINKVIQAIKEQITKKELESITFGFPQLVSIKIKDP